MLVGQIDSAHLMVRLPDHDHFFRTLDEKDRLNRIERKAWNADRPAARRPAEPRLSGEDAFIVFAQFLPGPGLKDRVAEIGNGKLPTPR